MAAMTTEQKRLVKSTAPILQTEGERITKHFYKRMLDNNDKLKNIFNLAHQETGAQPRALAHAVFAYAANIDNLGMFLIFSIFFIFYFIIFYYYYFFYFFKFFCIILYHHPL